MTTEKTAPAALVWTYRISTGVVALMMLFSVFLYFTSAEVKGSFAHLGFPDYFRVELGIAKFLGVLALVLPQAGRLKEWAYAGFAITFVSAFLAHQQSGDPVSAMAAPLVFLAILLVSYVSGRKAGQWE